MNYPSRRQFLGTLASAAALAPFASFAQGTPPTGSGRKVKVGLVGCGVRGKWIGGLLQQHGGFELHATGDYFQSAADQGGDALQVAPGRRFSGLSAYQKVIASGAEAIICETPPCFFATHATAAVEAGLHVYMAKPVAVDVPGCLAVQKAAQKATEKGKIFLVDFQMPTDPTNIEVAQRIRDGGLGKVVQIQTFGIGGGIGDPPLGPTIADRLQGLTWINDIAIGGDFIVNYDIHAIDAAMWVIGERPVSAAGGSSVARPDPHGNAHDVCSVVYNYASGIVHNHFGQSVNNNFYSAPESLKAVISGQTAYAQVNYVGKSFVRGGDKHFAGGTPVNLYQEGAVRNIAAFHKSIIEGNAANLTVKPSVDSCLACILGREAAERGVTLSMDELLKENKSVVLNLEGLEA